jgi:hypothetical protein
VNLVVSFVHALGTKPPAVQSLLNLRKPPDGRKPD